jgi:hypothetical protein
MRARREVTLTAICVLLVACSAAASAPNESHDPTVAGVGVLPSNNPDADVIVTEPDTVVSTSTTVEPTTTVAPLPPIGSLVAGNKLLMIGDSITASAAKRYGGELCDALVPLGWQVEVDAEPSRFVDFGNTVLDKRLSAKWDAAYVFLGTNYLGDQFAYRKQLEKIVERLAPTPVVLLTVTLFDASRREVNDAITLVAAQFPQVRVLDWGSLADADAATILRGDGHHLTDAGRLTLASTVAAVMGAAPAEPGKCLSTSFTNDSGASVNGSDTPPANPVARATTTTVGGGGGGTPTTKPAGTAATSAPTQPTVAPTVAEPVVTTTPQPLSTRAPRPTNPPPVSPPVPPNTGA